MAAGPGPQRGPKGSLLLGHLPELQQDWLGTLRRWQQEYGDFVVARLGPRPAVFVFDPKDAEAILITKYKASRKNFIIRRTQALIGDGLLLSEGEFWRRQRRLMQPAFHRASIDRYAQFMAEVTQERLDQWQDGQALDIHAELVLLTRSIVSRSLFGSDVDDEDREIETTIDRLVNDFSKLTDSPVLIPLAVPTPTNLRFRRDREKLDRLVFRFIERRRREPGDRNDLISMLLRAQDEDGSRMTDRQLRDEVITLFLAGHETTASALTWAIYLLTAYPEAAQRLAQEADRVLGGRPPTAEDVPHLTYAENVFKEAMRLYPPNWIMGRETTEPIEVRGRIIPKGWNLLISPWVIHRDPRWFDEPDTFRPERWESEGVKNLPTCAYLPFGAGPRQCIGRHFAMMEGVIILASIVQRYRLHRDLSRPVVPLPLVSIRPKGGLVVTVERRQRRPADRALQPR